jgi:hypothetical protein
MSLFAGDSLVREESSANFGLFLLKGVRRAAAGMLLAIVVRVAKHALFGPFFNQVRHNTAEIKEIGLA